MDVNGTRTNPIAEDETVKIVGWRRPDDRVVILVSRGDRAVVALSKGLLGSSFKDAISRAVPPNLLGAVNEWLEADSDDDE